MSIFERKEDAYFVAHAREDIPRLVAEVERLRERLSQAESLLGRAHDLLDDIHGYDTEIYREISQYFDGGDDE